MTKEALKMALEALESSRLFVMSREVIKRPEGADWYDSRITAIKEALAEPEQEPKCGAIIEVFGKDWRLEYLSLPVGKHKLYTQQYTYIPSPKQKVVGWKLVPIKPTDEMLKAMDECSTEGYDERLYAGHAASVYMAAVDVAPTPPQRKPLSEEEIGAILEDVNAYGTRLYTFARAIEAAHGIKGEA